MYIYTYIYNINNYLVEYNTMFNIHRKMGDIHEYESAFIVLDKNPDMNLHFYWIE